MGVPWYDRKVNGGDCKVSSVCFLFCSFAKNVMSMYFAVCNLNVVVGKNKKRVMKYAQQNFPLHRNIVTGNVSDHILYDAKLFYREFGLCICHVLTDGGYFPIAKIKILGHGENVRLWVMTGTLDKRRPRKIKHRQYISERRWLYERQQRRAAYKMMTA
jgi:hypothetical protein